jgi:ligand-binding SRPBCC domain-containing protein
MRHTFHSEQWLPYPVEAVFAFFADPENLPRLMPSWQKARIEDAAFVAPPPRPAAASASLAKTTFAGQGTHMTISFRPIPLSPIRLSWEAEITEFVWNDHFCDRQLKGPFAYWNHCHSVRSQTNSSTGSPGTLLTDDVDYELPFGRLGELAEHLFIARQLRSTFDYRQARTHELLPHVLPPHEATPAK